MYNKLIVAPESEIAEHRETTQEILELVADLRVLGRKEFKQLLKWRQEARHEPRRPHFPSRSARRPTLQAAGSCAVCAETAVPVGSPPPPHRSSRRACGRRRRR